MKKTLLVVGLLLSSSLSVWSQTTDVGDPVSWKGKLDASKNIPTETMPAFDVDAMIAADAVNAQNKAIPFRFGYEHIVELNLQNSGDWTILPNGAKVWRLKLKSTGAISLNLVFNDFFLANGAYLSMYSVDRSYLQGAYTSKNNNVNEMLGTDLMPGEEMIVELFEPANATNPSRLQIGTIVHGYKDINNWAPEKVNESGGCNLDVVCPAGDDWGNEINSVARILNGGGLCTGTLVTNVAQDGTPYFLTADHCSPASMGAAVFKFNYKSPTCGTQTNSDATDPGTNDIINGSTFRASRAESDFGLVELNSTPPASYGIYYAGWDNSGNALAEAIGIHHPAGDVMKISFDDDPLTITSYLNNAVPGDGSHWRVETWERNTTTEGGSSGSALFDANHRVIGQLHGGYAACGNTTSDWYGMFSVSWDGASSSERLRDWLDPLNTTTTIDGFDPNAPAVANDAQIQSVTDPTGIVCGTTISPVVTLKNVGSSTLTSVTITYNIDGGTNNTFPWTGSLTTGQSEVVNLTAIAITAGGHTLNASVLNPNGVADENTANDGSSSAYTAFTDGVTVNLELNTDCWGSETDWVIADGGTDLYSGSGYGDVNGGETFSESFCLDPGCYDFEINDGYGDGMFGSQYGSCDVDGSYYITVAGRHVDSIQAVDSDYGNQEVNNFCVKSIYSDFSSDVQSTCENSVVSFTASPLIGIATSYTWVFEGGTASSLTAANPTVTYAAAGTYDVTLTVGDGNDVDTYVLTDYITVLDAPEVTQGTVVHVQCNGGDDGSINPVVSGGDGSYTYAWDNGAGTNVNASSLEADDYTLTVTDGNMCEGSVMVAINEPAILVVDVTTNPATCGSSNGDATAAVSGGTGTYDYDWSSGGTAATETSLPGGAITVTVTDDNSCEMIGSGSVTTSNGPVITLNSYEDVSCNGGSDGSVNVTVSGGAGSNVYAWSNGGGTAEDASGLSANTYILTVTDANDCVSSLEQEIVEPSVLTATIVTSDAGCELSDGSATVTPAGGTSGYSYDWSTGGTDATENGVPSGAISVIVTDSEMCTFNASGVVNSPNAPVVSLNSVTNVDCNGGANGAIDIDVTGGSGGNSFVWTNGGGSNEDVTGAGAGEYTVTVTDMSNCTAVLTQEITENNVIEVTAVLTNENAGNDGEIDMTVSGGDGSYVFAWDNSLPATEDQTGLASGTYSVTITDGLGCSKDTSFTLNNVGIDESAGIESAIYPNPTTGVLNIELKEVNVSISIVNAFGQSVMNLRTTDTISVLNLGGFTKGMYMIQMTNESGDKSTKKIVLLD